MSKVKTEYINGTNFYVFELGDLSDRKERSLGRWRIARALNKKKVYIGCLSCNKIIEVNIGHVNVNGFVAAYGCPDCGYEFYSKLLLWKEYLEESRKS